MIYEKALNIYVDGSSYPRPRRGGIGVRYVTIDDLGHEVVEDGDFAGYEQATNNQMELMACIKGLEGASSHPKLSIVEKVYVFTDSMYVTENLNAAKYTWPNQQWLNFHGRPVENTDLWKGLTKEIKKISKRIDFKWVKGHSKNIHNKAVDKSAKRSANGFLLPPLVVSSVRRKLTSKSVESGSVPMNGQQMDIRIITDMYFKTQRLYKYKYEILSQDSECCGTVDLIFSKHLLRAGHRYRVVVNNEARNPRIVEQLSELDKNLNPIE